MAKGGGRKPSEKQMSPAQGSGGGKFGSRTLIGVTPALSAEDAERAAEAFVPLWQLDDAPFAAGAKLGEDDLRSLAGPLTAPLALQHAPPPVIRAATSAAGSTDSSVDPRHELATRATVKMTPVPAALHQPSPAHPTEPELPSVIVAEPEPVLPAAPVSAGPISAQPISAQPISAQPASEPPAPARKTDPPARRAPPLAATQPMSGLVSLATSPAPTAVYALPRSRTPMLVGIGGAGVVILGIVIYLASGSSASDASKSTTAVTAPTTHGTQPTVNIPPPPPIDEAPPAPTATATATAIVPPPQRLPPVAAQPATPTPTSVPVTTPAVYTPPTAAPAQTPRMAANPPAPPPQTQTRKPPKNPPPPPAPGGIVRDNPF